MTAALLRPPPWTTHAVCADRDPAIFDADTGPMTTEALAICATCPVRYECARTALDDAIPHGTWGGLTPDDRRRIARGEHGNLGTYRHPGAAPHGTRACYVAGCRRDECRAAHTTYERERKRRHAPTTTRRHAA